MTHAHGDRDNAEHLQRDELVVLMRAIPRPHVIRELLTQHRDQVLDEAARERAVVTREQLRARLLDEHLLFALGERLVRHTVGGQRHDRDERAREVGDGALQLRRDVEAGGNEQANEAGGNGASDTCSDGSEHDALLQAALLSTSSEKRIWCSSAVCSQLRFWQCQQKRSPRLSRVMSAYSSGP